MSDKIVYSMATIKKREKSLQQVVSSVINQCDELWIYLNDYSTVPKWLENKKIKTFIGLGDIGDIGKFHRADEINGYHFTIDDDIIYPPDYSRRMIEAIEKYNRLGAVAVHGARLHTPLGNYFRNRTHYHFRKKIDTPIFTDVIGTGTLAFHTDTVKVSRNDFDLPNMCDIYFAIKAQKEKLPLIIINRKELWLKDSQSYNTRDSIYSKTVNKKCSDNPQSNLIKEHAKKHGWKVFSIGEK